MTLQVEDFRSYQKNQTKKTNIWDLHESLSYVQAITFNLWHVSVPLKKKKIARQINRQILAEIVS